MKLPEEVIDFFHKQNFTIVSTIDKFGQPHNSCKGLVEIKPSGKVYLLDLYLGQTHANLKHNQHVALTAVDEHRFRGYSLKGAAKIVNRDKLGQAVIKAWEKRIANRVTQRVLKNMSGDKGHHTHPEALLPQPAYLIAMEVKEIVDLTPHHLK
ncbi:pyridoxamine 5'-phosphate oxidase family protein [Candidatus Omnitrophota bacterium]